MATIWTEIGTGTQALVTLPFDNGSVDGDQYPSLNAAITAIGASQKTLVLGTQKTLTANLTIPSTLQLVIKQGGGITLSGYILTLTTIPVAGEYQIFFGAVAGSIVGLRKVNPKWLGTLNSTITILATNPAQVILDYPETLTANLTIPSTLSLEITKDGSIAKASTYTLTINSPFSAGLYQVFSGFSVGDVTLGSGTVKGVYPEWWGALGNDSTDSTTALSSACTAAASTKALVLSDGLYRVTSTTGNFALTASCAIIGSGPNKSKIRNIGTGSALRLIGPLYYERFKNFSVIGNVNSQDGIVTMASGNETAYSSFVSVDSASHGRHGFVHQDAWATRYIDCKAYNNGGLGWYFNALSGAEGNHNGITLINCESRHNGGTANETGNYLKGGVRVIGGASWHWIGGVTESNNAWDFIIGDATNTYATQVVTIEKIYMEDTPKSPSTSTGGHIRVLGTAYQRVEVHNNWISYGAAIGGTGYAFYVDSVSSTDSYFKEWGNHTADSGAGTNIRDYGLIYDFSKTYVSKGLDSGTYTIVSANGTGSWTVRGNIHIKWKGFNHNGIYPFSATYDPGAGGLVTTIATTSLIPYGGTAPTIAWNAGDLQVVFAANHYGYVELGLGGITLSAPTVFSLPATIWGNDFVKRSRLV